jgi:flagellar motility protein MotE (MotC chaperone)
MNKKQIILIILLILIPTIVLLSGFLAVYKFYPGLLGIPTNDEATFKQIATLESSSNSYIESTNSDTIIKPQVSDFESLFSKLIYIENHYNKKDNFLIKNSQLKDSIINLSSQLSSLQDSLSKQIAENTSSLSLLAKLGDSLAEAKARLNYKMKNYSQAKENNNERQPQNIQKNVDSLRISNVRELSQIFNNIESEKAARILENTNASNAIRILKAMDKKKAGKIIDVMKPKFSASLLEFELGN